MKIKVGSLKVQVLARLEIGDVVEVRDGEFYMVGREGAMDGSILLRELHTGCYANGRYADLRALTNKVEQNHWKVYPRSDYDLVLTRKENN